MFTKEGNKKNVCNKILTCFMYIKNPKFYDFEFLATESIFVSFPDWRTKESLDSDICIATEENKYVVHNTLFEAYRFGKYSTFSTRLYIALRSVNKAIIMYLIKYQLLIYFLYIKNENCGFDWDFHLINIWQMFNVATDAITDKPYI